MKATWRSRRNLSRLFDQIVTDEAVTFGVLYGNIDHDRRWFDLEHAREMIGYQLVDNGEE